MYGRYKQKQAMKGNSWDQLTDYTKNGGAIMRKLTEMYVKMQSMVKDEKGQTMVEYALVIVLVALVVAVAIPGVTTAISGAFGHIVTALG